MNVKRATEAAQLAQTLDLKAGYNPNPYTETEAYRAALAVLNNDADDWRGAEAAAQAVFVKARMPW